MNNRSVIVNQLRDFFKSIGKVPTYEEYKEMENTPVRLQILKRRLGSWPRILNMVGEVDFEPEAPPTPVTQQKPTQKKNG